MLLLLLLKCYYYYIIPAFAACESQAWIQDHREKTQGTTRKKNSIHLPLPRQKSWFQNYLRTTTSKFLTDVGCHHYHNYRHHHHHHHPHNHPHHHHHITSKFVTDVGRQAENVHIFAFPVSDLVL